MEQYRLLSRALPFVEVTLGSLAAIASAFDRGEAPTRVGVSLLFLSFLLIQLVIVRRRTAAVCGCFGGGRSRVGRRLVLRTSAFAAASLIAVVR